ncbi:ABC transporter permease [Arhodomonas sp. AD133]|uniref:ABC transporter permease n=1 Tax=Arhodomonas sp. AD133 TaxID=3415009 RepID=UPI003EBDF4A6
MSTAVAVHSREWFAVLRRFPWVVAAVAAVVLFTINAALQGNLLEAPVLVSNLRTVLPLLLVAVGQTYVILNSDIDLSIGAVISLVNVVAVSVMGMVGGGAGIALGMLAGLATGLACGLANGLLIAGLRFQPIVTTFATGIVFGGLALWVLPEAGAPVPEGYWRGYAGSWMGLPVPLWVAAAALVWIGVFARTRNHRRLLATGGRLEAAFQSGVPVRRARINGYALCGLFGALSAFCLTGDTATGDPLIGQAFTLSSISAVVLGGTALSGGVGGALGTVFGAVILVLINNIIFFANLPFEYQNLVQGLIVLVALALGVFVARR